MTPHLPGIGDDLYIQCILGDPFVHDSLARTVKNPSFPTARELMARCRVLLFDEVQGFVAFEPVKLSLPALAYEIHVCFLPGQGSAVHRAIEAAIRYVFLETSGEVITAKISFMSPHRGRLLMLAGRFGFRVRTEDDEFTLMSLSAEDWVIRHAAKLKSTFPGWFKDQPAKTKLFEAAWAAMKLMAENGMPEKGARTYQGVALLLGRNPNFEVETLHPLTVKLDGVTIAVSRGEPCPS